MERSLILPTECHPVTVTSARWNGGLRPPTMHLSSALIWDRRQWSALDVLTAAGDLCAFSRDLTHGK